VESRGISDWTPDPFDVAQGRGEHSRTTIKTFGGDDLACRGLEGDGANQETDKRRDPFSSSAGERKIIEQFVVKKEPTANLRRRENLES
jgi:hypothetical protein